MFKEQFPFAEITFTANKENLTYGEVSALKSSPEISEVIVYDKRKISLFRYIHLLQKKRFDISLVLSSSDAPQTIKTTLVSLMSKAKWKAFYDIDRNKMKEGLLLPLAKNKFRKIIMLMFMLIIMSLITLLLPIIFLGVYVFIFPFLRKCRKHV